MPYEIDSERHQAAMVFEAYYQDNLKEELEQTHFGQYVVFMLGSDKYFIRESSRAALDLVLEAEPHQYFHLVRIGGHVTI